MQGLDARVQDAGFAHMDPSNTYSRNFEPWLKVLSWEKKRKTEQRCRR